jgi:aminoglycoside phosphotransferase (APT) family kinase protein
MILRRPGEQTLQRNPRAGEDEFKVLQLTHALGLPVPAPYYLDQSGTIFSTPCLITEYIEGKPKFPSLPDSDFIFQIASHLAMIHHADLSGRDLSFLPQAGSGCVEVSRKPSPALSPALAVQSLPESLEKVSPPVGRNQSALLHGDYWPGNLLWRDHRLVAVIDWEDAQIGDPLIDLAITRLDILWIFGLDAFESFTQQYQTLMDIDYANLPFWDLCAALRLSRLVGSNLAGWTAFFIPYGRHDITEHTLREHFQFFMTQAFERLAP